MEKHFEIKKSRFLLSKVSNDFGLSQYELLKDTSHLFNL